MKQQGAKPGTPLPKQATEAVQFGTLLNRPPTEPSPAGSKIYEWEYLDEKGELKKDKRNVYEQIQSYNRQTDYKARIARGELIDENPGLYMDLSTLGNSPDAINNWIANLASRVRTDIEQQIINQQAQKDSAEMPKTQEPSGQVMSEKQEPSGQVMSEKQETTTGGNKQ